MAEKKEKPSTINFDTIPSFTDFVALPFKAVGCWEWFPRTDNVYFIIINNVYVALVLVFLMNMMVTFIMSAYVDRDEGEAPNLDIIAESLPFAASFVIVVYFTMRRSQLYELVDFMNDHFKFHSARGLTNMTMIQSYRTAKCFQYVYITSVCWSVTMYTVGPVIVHWWTQEPLVGWYYTEVTQLRFLVLSFLRHLLTQLFMGIALGQLSIFFAMNAILICGQLELLCCSVRNARFTAILQNGVQHGALVRSFGHVMQDEAFNYMYNKSEMVDSEYNYDSKVSNEFQDRKSSFEIYDKSHDKATEETLRDCVRLCQMIAIYKAKFERFFSPLLAVRVVQVTLYTSTLLYSLSRKFNMMASEYLVAVACDIFIYCYYGNQITIQGDRVTTAASQSFWHTAGVRPRRLLLNLLLGNKRQIIVRAGRFLPMDLRTYVTIIKTSFSYYTLLANVNEQS